MTNWVRFLSITIVSGLIGAGTAGAQRVEIDSRVAALVGLARTARDQGRAGEAASRFREADALQPFSGPLLVEYFWAAHAAHTADAMELGSRILAANPRDSRVRDGMIGLAVAGTDDTAASRLAEQGRLLDPNGALWMRRLGESHLRSGRYLLGAQQFLAASTATGGEAADRAQWAFCLELSGQKAAAARAWTKVSDELSSSRRDWTESRARAFAPASAPPVRRAEAPAPTAADIATAAQRRLSAEPCAQQPLESLERLVDHEPFVTAVAARPTSCAGAAAWISRAVERFIAIGAFDRALGLAHSVAVDGSPLALREQTGVLMHWTGRDGEAVPVLRAVVAEQPGPSRAATALIEALRATSQSDEAWELADHSWRGDPAALHRLGLAQLALETGRLVEALDLSRSLQTDDLLAERAAVVEGSALLALGRAAEARLVLQRAMPSAAAAAPWLDAVAKIDGIAVALAESSRLPVSDAPAWVDVHARRAVWNARLGRTAASGAALSTVTATDPVRGRLVVADLALAAGRPIDAERVLRRLLKSHPQDVGAMEALGTSLAEQGRFDEAESVIGVLRQQRPTEVRWAIREAEWRHRRAPTAEHLNALAAIVASSPVTEARSALARALFRSGQFARAAVALGDPSALTEADRMLVARSLRAMGRTGAALDVLNTRPMDTVEGLTLKAELDVAVNGAAAADRTFAALVSRGDADPAWYLAWADAHLGGFDQMRILEQGAARFPSSAELHERLAVTAWAAGNAERASRAAEVAIRADASRPGAWFVKIDLAGHDTPPSPLLPLLDQFEVRFGPASDARVGMAEMIAGLHRPAGDVVAWRASGWMEERLRRNPSDAPAAIARARLLAATGAVGRALEAVETLVGERPELPAALKLRAELLASTGRYADSVDAYERYLSVAPDDLGARRQQARVEGWRGAYGASEARYAALRDREPAAAVVSAEADAKAAYYGGNWNVAAARYDQWLRLDPKDVEARLERAQLEDRLGRPERALTGFHAVSASAAPNAVATLAAERIERRRSPSIDVFTTAQSADASQRQQLLDLVDSGVGLGDDLGLGYLTRGRLFGGPSWAEGEGGPWRGHHVGLQMSTSLAPPLRAKGSIAYRQLDTFDAAWFGDLGMTWRLGSRVRLSAGAERWLLLENASTLASGTFGIGPTASLRWTPTIDLSVDGAVASSTLSDDNLRRTVRLGVSQRVLRGRHELKLIATTDGLSFRDERSTYFTPGSFWRVDGGAEWRGWLSIPRFFGDRERWLSAGYTFGVDDRNVGYHTMRAGFSYELTGGVAFVADGQVTRSAVYNAGRLSIGLRLRQVTLPEP